MTENEISPRVRPALPRGLADRDASDIAAADAMMAKIREVYALYGFEAVETPFIEYTEALGKFLPDQDRPNEGVFSFKDDDEQWLSLRYDLTAPLARHVAENYDRLPKPYRSYRAGWVFRNEKPGPGRFRQFMQFDADTVGAASPAADAEICMMAADCLEALGIARGDYVIKVNNRKVLDGVMESIGLGGAENAEAAADGPTGDRQARSTGRGRGALVAWHRAQGRERRFHQGRGARVANQIERILVFAALQNVTLVGNATDSVQSDMGPGEKIHTFQSLDGEMLHHVESNTATIEQLGARFGNSRTSREGIAELRGNSNLS